MGSRHRSSLAARGSYAGRSSGNSGAATYGAGQGSGDDVAAAIVDDAVAGGNASFSRADPRFSAYEAGLVSPGDAS
jgi:hypothetical protein